MAYIDSVTVTADSFAVLVLGIKVGDTVRFYLSYADASWNPTTAIVSGSGEGQYGPSTSAGGHTFRASGLKSNSRLVYTIAVTDSSGKSTNLCEREHAQTSSGTGKTWPGDFTRWANITSWNITRPISAADWNAFLDHINNVIDYKGGTKVSWSGRYAVANVTNMDASYFNMGAATAMRSIGLNPPTAMQNADITPSFFKQYEDALNAAK